MPGLPPPPRDPGSVAARSAAGGFVGRPPSPRRRGQQVKVIREQGPRQVAAPYKLPSPQLNSQMFQSTVTVELCFLGGLHFPTAVVSTTQRKTTVLTVFSNLVMQRVYPQVTTDHLYLPVISLEPPVGCYRY